MRVFISYCRRCPAAGQILGPLEQALKKRGHYPFIDKEGIRPGDDWKKTLRIALARTYAGVFLLSKEALKSEWVLAELTIMSARKEIHPAFKLIPALLDEETLAKVQASDHWARWFSPVALKDLQLIERQRVGNPSPTEWAELLATAVGDPPGVDAPATLLEELARHLQDVFELRRVTFAQIRATARAVTSWLEEAGLTGLSEGLAEELADLHLACQVEHHGDARAALAKVISLLLLAEGLPSFKEPFRELQRWMPPDEARELLQFVEPLWIQREEAARLRAPIVGLHGESIFKHTGPWFARRAHWPDQVRIIPVTSTGTAKEIAAEIDRWVADREEVSVDEVRANLMDSDDPAYVLLKGERAAVPELLDTLHAWYPTVTFVLDLGEHRSQAPPEPITEIPPIDRLSEGRNLKAHRHMAYWCNDRKRG